MSYKLKPNKRLSEIIQKMRDGEALPLYQEYTCPDDYYNNDVVWLEPMSAKGAPEEKVDEILNDEDIIVELKIDGERATMHIKWDGCRVFSRRVSTKTKWFSENSDRLPHIRDYLDTPEQLCLQDTIIDGEIVIPNRPFKDVSSTLNCLPEEAIQRQLEIGLCTFNAFDITHHCGRDCRELPLSERKLLLKNVIDTLHNPCVKLLPYYIGNSIPVSLTGKEIYKLVDNTETYPTLHKEFTSYRDLTSFRVSNKAFYEYVVLTGGEGIMIKDPNGKYYSKRGREYQKVKKFYTRDVIVLGFSPPTKEYEGKFPKDRWDFWINIEDLKQREDICSTTSAKSLLNRGLLPVTKYYYEDWVGNVQFGVIVSKEEQDNLLNSKKGKQFIFIEKVIEGENVTVLDIGECGGITEEMRECMTINREEMIDTVIEVKCNEIFTDTGKMRHPRFMRLRPDKSPLTCVWGEHIDQ